MELMQFPPSYRKSLISGKKNTTIRILDECGKYSAGKAYLAVSYSGKSLDVRIKVLEVTKAKVSGLKALGLARKSIACIERQAGKNALIEVIRFEIS